MVSCVSAATFPPGFALPLILAEAATAADARGDVKTMDTLAEPLSTNGRLGDAVLSDEEALRVCPEIALRRKPAENEANCSMAYGAEARQIKRRMRVRSFGHSVLWG